MQEFVLPKPKDEKVFEDLVTDLSCRRYNFNHFQKYGKKGQEQFGVDTVGIVENKIIALQSKNHSDPKGKITVNDIDAEISKSENFSPQIDEYHIYTSASNDNDNKIISHVLEQCKKRKAEETYPVFIHFWEDICRELGDYPDILYKYFSRLFPIERATDITNFKTPFKISTIEYPFTTDDLDELIKTNLQNIPFESPYDLKLGISSFEDTNFKNITDVDLLIPENFKEVGDILVNLKRDLSNNNISKDLTVFFNARIAFGFLFGYVFNKVSNYRLRVISGGNQIWKSWDLPWVNPRVSENLPVIINPKATDVSIVLNISRNITDDVKTYLESVNSNSKFILSYGVEGNSIESAAHALAVAKSIAQKIKLISNNSDINEINFFGAIPAGLAILIGWHLNAIKPLNVYYWNKEKNVYEKGGTLS